MQYLPNAGNAARSIAWYGEYHQFELDLLSRLIRPGAFIVEAGSGVGEHAIALAKMVSAQGQLWVYETHAVYRQILRHNLDVNRVAGNVTLMRRGLAGPDSEESTDTLDALLLDRLDLIKIRTDATAGEILAGATDTLWRLRPILFMATTDDVAMMDLAARVKEFGYRCWRVESPLFNPHNFNRRDADIFNAETALAMVAIPEEVDAVIAVEGCVELTGTPDLRIGTTIENARPGLMGKLRKLLR